MSLAMAHPARRLCSALDGFAQILRIFMQISCSAFACVAGAATPPLLMLERQLGDGAAVEAFDRLDKGRPSDRKRGRSIVEAF